MTETPTPTTLTDTPPSFPRIPRGEKELGDLASSMANAMLGPFEVHDVLGEGGMGIVFSGRHLAENVPVAIKVITRRGAQRPKFRQTMHNEVRAVAGLNHPGIVRVLDYGEIPPGAEVLTDGALRAGSPYFAMELVPHGSMVDVMGRVTWKQARAFLLGILDALAHSHARNVIHRDIKPGNILLGDWGGKLIPRLADFGLAFAAGAPTDASRSIGTPQYMAPEQIETPWRKHGPWSDLYSVGCVAFELLSGRKLFQGASVLEIFRLHLDGARRPLRSIVRPPEGFDRWLLKMLARNPQERFQSAADAARALYALDPVGSSTRPPDILEAEVATLTPVLEARLDGPQALPAELVWPRRLATSMRLVGAGLGLWGLREVPLAGRAEERAMLWNALRDCRQSGPRVMVVRGQHGVGKTKLVQAFSERIGELGIAAILRTQHVTEAGGADGLAGLVARHVRALGTTRVEAAGIVREHLASLGVDDVYAWRATSAVIEPAVEHDADAEHHGRRAFEFTTVEQRWDAVLRYLQWHAKERPVLVVLDDIHLSRDSVDFVRYVLARDETSPILLVVTCSDEALAVNETARDLIAELLENERVREVPLGPLDEYEHLDLVEDLLMLTPEVALEVADRTAGNPGFAVSLIGEWVSGGQLRVGQTGFVLEPDALDGVPESAGQLLRGVLEDLVGGYRDDDWKSLEVAAALGGTVRAQEWSGICQSLGFEPSWELLDEFIERRLVRTVGFDWTFQHPILREWLKGRAAEAGRWARWKRQCGHYLAGTKRADDLGPDELERLGGYWLDAGEFEDALEPLRRGALRRQQRGEYRRAERLSTGIVRALEETGGGSRQLADVYLFRAASYTSLAQPDEVLRWATKALEIGEEEGLPDIVARASGCIAVAKQWLGDPKASEWVDRAVSLVDELGDAFEPEGALIVLAYLLTSLGRFDRATAILELDRRLAERRSDELGLAKNAYQFCRLGVHLRDDDVAIRYGEEAVERYHQAHQIPALASVQNMLGEVYRKRGDYDRAEEMYRESIRLHQTIGRSSDVSLINLGHILLQRGETSAAEDAFLAARAGLRAAGRRRLAMICQAGLVQCAVREQQWHAAMRLLPEIAEFVRVAQEAEADIAELLEGAGDVLQREGRAGEASEVWHVALAQWELVGASAQCEVLVEKLAGVEGL